MSSAYMRNPDDVSGWLDTSVFLLAQQSLADRMTGLSRQFATAARPSTSIYQTQKKHALAESIRELADLEENWDGEGGSPVALEAIERAVLLLSVMNEAVPLPEFSPNPNGTLSLYWNVPHGSAELEIGRTRHSWALADVAGTVTTFCSGDNRALDNPASLMDLLAALTPSLVYGTHPLTRLVMRHEWNETLDSL